VANQYYNGEDLKKCEENGITAIVSKQRFGNSTGDKDFAKDKFTYDQEKRYVLWRYLMYSHNFIGGCYLTVTIVALVLLDLI